ncbi:GH25 family lysozyme [Pseudosulfitobacter sp. DSM 107133]|uniref:glycoside hydrolase family 25 protein n=1 Tax=Pseudosulfitobacter sp. DSM 107133 TaxID=2883100 RepID=UPI000DF4B426|nr:GH25 family lysozyme [Pseudosulfitobacter sp. DSM 107133]UOA28494.1 Lysozyme M1 [Pseudosulfitobacter sp. DSM 107133]
MSLPRRLALLTLLALAACGAPRAPDGVVFAPRFSDAHPVDFRGRAPQRYPVQGIDAARFQTSIDWNTARRNGVNFAFLKATEGGDLLDPAFKQHWRDAGRAGVERGAYHFYYFCTSPEDQARWFIRNVPRTAGMLPPVLDMEWNPFSPTCAHVRPPASEVRNQMRRWVKIVEAHYGLRPIIYTTPKFFEENGLRSFRGYDFWLRSTAKSVSEAYPGQRWKFWQYSSTGLIPGIVGEVDLNVYNGNRAEWETWLSSHKI